MRSLFVFWATNGSGATRHGLGLAGYWLAAVSVVSCGQSGDSEPTAASSADATASGSSPSGADGSTTSPVNTPAGPVTQPRPTPPTPGSSPQPNVPAAGGNGGNGPVSPPSIPVTPPSNDPGQAGSNQGGEPAMPQGGNGGTPTGNGGEAANGGANNVAGNDSGGVGAMDAAGSAGTPASGGAAGASSDCTAPNAAYDAVVLCDGPVGFWALNQGSGEVPDLTGNGHTGQHEGSDTPLAMLPNGDMASDFDGESQFVSVPSDPSFSIPTTGTMTWEAWIQPAVLQFPNDSGGYVDWMGKCEEYGPTCEWEARLYNTENDQGRCNRFSAYAFNPGAGLGSGADFQPTCGLIQARNWYHVVGEYTLLDEPDDCENAEQYPGSIEIWVNGVQWDHSSHGQTGCMSQYDVIPEANDSAVNIGTMAEDAWFQGAIGKVAIYDKLLTNEQIANHYRAMTGQEPSGSCGDDCTLE